MLGRPDALHAARRGRDGVAVGDAPARPMGGRPRGAVPVIRPVRGDRPTPIVSSSRPDGRGGRSDALPGHRTRRSGPGWRARARDRGRLARPRVGGRRRVPAQHERRARTRGRPRAVGRGLLLPHAARRRARVLGGVLHPRQGAGRARAQPLPRSERDRAVVVRRLRLHGAPRRTARGQGRPFRPSKSRFILAACRRLLYRRC